MKKLLLTLAAAAAMLPLAASDLTFTLVTGLPGNEKSEVFESGSTVVIGPEELFEGAGVYKCTGSFIVSSSASVNAHVYFENTESADGDYIELCIEPLCMVDKVIEKDISVSPFTKVDLHFATQNVVDPAVPQTWKGKLTVTSPEQTYNFDIVLSTDPNASLGSILVNDGTTVRMSGKTLRWKSETAPGTLEIFDLEGKLLYRAAASAASGSANLSRLPMGNYLYRLGNAKGRIALK